MTTQASGYERRIGRYGASLAGAFVAACEVEPAWRVLDVGCGTGVLACELAAVVGRESVAAVDPDAAAVQECAARLPQADVRVGTAENLPFVDGAFDATLAQLVVSLMDDAQRGASEMARVTRPGGLVAACVWDFADGMRVLRAFWDAAAVVDREGAARHDQAVTRGYATPDALAELWRGAGLQSVTTGALQARTTYAGFDDLWEPLLVPDGGPGVYLATVDEQARDAIRAELFARLGAPAGRFELEARAWYVAGRV